MLELGDFAKQEGESIETKQRENWLVMIDTSASTANVHARRVGMIASIVDKLLMSASNDSTVQFAVFDIEVAEVLQPMSVRDFDSEALVDALTKRLPLGLSDMSGAIAHVSDAVANANVNNVLLLTDGMATAGKAREPAPLGNMIARQLMGTKARVFCMPIGTRFDKAILERLTQGRGRVVNVPVTSDESVLDNAIFELRAPVGATLYIDVPDALWVEPSVFSDVASGDEIVFFVARKKGTALATPRVARFAADLGEIVEIGPSDMLMDEDYTGERVPAIELLVLREAHHAKIKQLERERSLVDTEEAREQLAADIVHESTTYRVLTPLTALIVLEFERQYEQFGIDRNSLTDILAGKIFFFVLFVDYFCNVNFVFAIVSDTGVVVLDREDINVKNRWEQRFEDEASFFSDTNDVLENANNFVNVGGDGFDVAQAQSVGAASSLSMSWPLLLAILLVFVVPQVDALQFIDPTPSTDDVSKAEKNVLDNPFVREHMSVLTTNQLLIGDFDALLSSASEWLLWDRYDFFIILYL